MSSIGDAHSWRELIYAISNIVLYVVLYRFEQFQIKNAYKIRDFAVKHCYVYNSSQIYFPYLMRFDTEFAFCVAIYTLGNQNTIKNPNDITF